MAVAKQGLAGPRRLATGAGALELVRDLRCLQLDPISAVARSHLLVLWSRLGAFDRALVDQLLWEERSLFEYWAHAASIVLTEDYPIHRLRMRAWPGDGTWQRRVVAWMEENRSLKRSILGQLRGNGPMPSRGFRDRAVAVWTSTGWTNERNVERMLSFLWSQGKVLVSGRAGGARLWDLPERVLPDWTPRGRLSERAAVRRSAELSLRALGVAREAHVRANFVAGRYPGFPGALRALERSGRIVPLEVVGDGLRPGPWYVHADDLALLERIEAGEWEPRTTLLSPFDNLIHDRRRTEELFGFTFRLEIYVPKAKRRHGYYVMPVLSDDRIVARLDPAVDRARSRLVIHAKHVEEGVKWTRALDRATRASIGELARFVGAEEIEDR
jgi:uncharacterized protein YcaQ